MRWLNKHVYCEYQRTIYLAFSLNICKNAADDTIIQNKIKKPILKSVTLSSFIFICMVKLRGIFTTVKNHQYYSWLLVKCVFIYSYVLVLCCRDPDLFSSLFLYYAPNQRAKIKIRINKIKGRIAHALILCNILLKRV